MQPNLTPHGDPLTLAWYVLGCNPGNYANFTWTVDYSLSWSQQGTLAPGVKFVTGGSSPVNTSTGDRIKFALSGPAYTFQGKAASAGAVGTCGVNSDNTVENGVCSVAISVAGKPVAAIPIQPNSAITFTPLPKYYLSFGSFVEGTVVDVATMVNSIELDYGGLGVFNLNYTLDARNNWTQN